MAGEPDFDEVVGCAVSGVVCLFMGCMALVAGLILIGFIRAAWNFAFGG